MSLAIILTARAGSERLPNKAVRDVAGKPLVGWIIERLIKIDAKVILATTEDIEDDFLAFIAEEHVLDVYRGDSNDVVKRMDNALKTYAPDATQVMRGLGDCPYISISLVQRASDVIMATGADAFAWHIPPDTLNTLVYGAREFPYSRAGWEKIVDLSRREEREHVDLFFHRNRGSFNVVYHEAPDSVYFRDYRLEVDWEEDLEMVSKVAEMYDPLAPLSNIVRFLDEHESISRINRERVERTGLSASYNYAEKRKWSKLMRGVPVVSWDDSTWYPPDDRAKPIFCKSGQCLIGYGFNGVLYRKNGGDQIVGKAYIDCKCGGGRIWNNPK